MQKHMKRVNGVQSKPQIHTTLGELLAASYAVTGGRPSEMVELFEAGGLRRLLVGRRVRFV